MTLQDLLQAIVKGQAHIDMFAVINKKLPGSPRLAAVDALILVRGGYAKIGDFMI